MSCKYVVINEQDGGAILCEGIFDDARTAIGEVMRDIWSFAHSYKNEGDEFNFSLPYDLEGKNGIGIAVTYKASSWEKSHKDYYFILNSFEE